MKLSDSIANNDTFLYSVIGVVAVEVALYIYLKANFNLDVLSPLTLN